MDKRLKRRKDKYNPYTLETVDNKFYVSFTDSNKIKQTVEVSQEVYVYPAPKTAVARGLNRILAARRTAAPPLI